MYYFNNIYSSRASIDSNCAAIYSTSRPCSIAALYNSIRYHHSAAIQPVDQSHGAATTFSVVERSFIIYSNSAVFYSSRPCSIAAMYVSVVSHFGAAIRARY